jgi:CubicO group peptidase (beta-lactamase class C family)
MYSRCLAVILLGAISSSPALAADPKPLVDEVVKPFLENKPYLGMAVGVVTPEARHTYYFGTVKLDGQDRPPDAGTIFPLGSLTKAYTGVVLADLVRAGKIKLDDPAQQHMPPEIVLPKRGERPITILDLATHYSGIPVQPNCLDFRGDPYASLTPAMIAKDLAAIELERDPGSGFAYSNYGAGLLGHALARAAGAKSYDDAITERIGKPLGLADTHVHLNDSQKGRLPPGFSRSGKPAPHWRFSMLESCGGLNSTVADQVQFIAANLEMVDSPIVAAMKESHKPQRDASSQQHRIGLGWHIVPLRADSKHSVVWHNGGTAAARCYLGFVPDAKVGVVILTNSANSVDPPSRTLLQKLVPE